MQLPRVDPNTDGYADPLEALDSDTARLGGGVTRRKHRHRPVTGHGELCFQ